MAVIQISKIQVRRGLEENLPQLSSGELGWSIDTQRLWIGNGTLQEGAPEIGNTEILTAGSRLPGVLAALYTFEGAEASPPYISQTGPSLSLRVERRIQDKLDEQISLRDFVTSSDKSSNDYTEALQRAIDQIYPQGYDDIPGVRRVLTIPAGTYNVSSVITVPPYVTIRGDGKSSTIIKQISASAEAVFKLRDSLAQVDANLGVDSAILPSYINFSNLTIENSTTNTVIIIDSANDVSFNSVRILGPYINTVTLSDEIPGVLMQSTVARTANVTFDQCEFTRSTYGIKAAGDVAAVSVTNSKFYMLYQAVISEQNTTNPQSIRITGSLFDSIAAQAIYAKDESSIVSAYNYYALVGYSNGTVMDSGTPTFPVLTWNTANNYSIADLFDRSAADTAILPLTEVLTYTTSTKQNPTISGTLKVLPGSIYVLVDDATTVTNLAINDSLAYIIDYVITRDTGIRIGTLKINNVGGVAAYDDEYTESSDIGISAEYSVSGTDIVLQYVATSTGVSATIKYNLRTFA